MSKIKVTQQQRDNLLDALHVMWPSVPEANVMHCLRDWRDSYGFADPDCGTVACFGGWCAHWPNFKNQGVRADYVGAPVIADSLTASQVSKILFGDWNLFKARTQHTADDDFTGSDHALVTNRLQWLLDNSEVAE